MFDNILGQDKAKRIITNSLRKNRISHGYLFEGPSGIGKMEFAIQFSKMLLGIENIENSPDIKVIEPDGASFKISQIRDICSDILIKPYGQKKIYILKDAHKMTIQAQNSLLKTLEEPPNYSVIILLAQNSYALLDTIKSRCEKIKFSPISQKEIEYYLINNNGIPKDRARVVASFSSGIISKALNLINNEEFNEIRDWVEKFIDLIFNGDKVSLMNIPSYLENYKHDIENILDMIITYFRDVMVVKEEIGEELIINLDKLELINDISKKLTYFQVSSIIDIIEETKKYIKSNCNFNLSIEVMVLNIQEVIK
ncbi:DNA polymerase III subunit [Alkalithermobacter paradoxus]|uniref:DNA polymerase III subunit delta' n=1 Tax=Alkalithermobacter paradoxus TaxID=29349 RepID=A0A1V4I4Y5_9FIRM|nr:DNA polymerase III subunit tau [[Clostridium] thermoalcaliphilum]